MRKPFVCGNWKMNMDRKGAVALAQGTAKTAGEVRGVEVGVCPPACYLEAVLGAVKGSALVVGGQNMHFEANGA
ncbi:MAG: triose-phosphate isomerase, partial [Planctomycetota bacterium]|nr:triose-phosphate isomerase [Planctomycetota bacterium]